MADDLATVLLVHCDGTNGATTFTDSSSYAHTLTAISSATVSTTTPKFGTGSAQFLVPASRIDTNNAARFNLGANQFTVEAWAYFSAAPSVQIILSQWANVANNLGWSFRLNSGALAFLYSTTGSDFPGVSAAFTPTTGIWYHLAADRDASNVLRVYVNGAVIASATVSSAIFPSTATCLIGNDQTATRSFPGRLDEVRVSVGVARYGGAFTPPTAPFDIVLAGGSQARVMVLA